MERVRLILGNIYRLHIGRGSYVIKTSERQVYGCLELFFYGIREHWSSTNQNPGYISILELELSEGETSVSNQEAKTIFYQTLAMPLQSVCQ